MVIHESLSVRGCQSLKLGLYLRSWDELNSPCKGDIVQNINIYRYTRGQGEKSKTGTVVYLDLRGPWDSQSLSQASLIVLLWTYITGGQVYSNLKLFPPTSEIGVRIPARAQVRKLVVACHWSAIYSTEP